MRAVARMQPLPGPAEKLNGPRKGVRSFDNQPRSDATTLFSTRVVVVHPHVHRLAHHVPDAAPDGTPGQLVSPKLALRTRSVLNVPVFPQLHAVDPPVRFAIRQIPGIDNQHDLPAMPLAPGVHRIGQVRREIARTDAGDVLQAYLRLEPPASRPLGRE